MEAKQKMGVRGIVTMRLRGSDGELKPLFRVNKIWKWIKKSFGIDLQIPFLTGIYTLEAIRMNTIADTGLSEGAKLLGGLSADPISHLAIGIGTPSSTALGSEITTGGGARASVTPTSQTDSVTGDTVRSENTFTFTSSFAITEEGLFNHASAGDMIASQNFATMNVVSGDSLTIQHDIIFGTA